MKAKDVLKERGEELVELPFVTFAIPTYNSGKRLERLLRSIVMQRYPRDNYEILIADGGSTDDTIDIAKRYGCIILHNPKKFAEPGKALCIDNAQGDIICFVDDDNELPSEGWLLKMVKPLVIEKDIVASEPIKFEYRKDMSTLDKYWALSGYNDPVMYYMGLYDKWNMVSGWWNGRGIKGEDKGDYIKFKIEDFSALLTLGANGFCVRTDAIRRVKYHELLDIDKVVELIKLGYNTFAKVKIGIYHYFCPTLKQYINKARRKARNITNPSHVGIKERRIKYPFIGILKFALVTITFIPLLYYIIKGYFRIRDRAWLMHIPVCWLTLTIYVEEYLDRLLRSRISDRVL
jgi:glycosyltransferase involved in cell wall biosynthesis